MFHEGFPFRQFFINTSSLYITIRCSPCTEESRVRQVVFERGQNMSSLELCWRTLK